MGVHNSVGVVTDIMYSLINILPLRDYSTAIALACTAKRFTPLLAHFRRVNCLAEVNDPITMSQHNDLQKTRSFHGKIVITNCSYHYILMLICQDMTSRSISYDTTITCKYVYGILHSTYWKKGTAYIYQRILKNGPSFLCLHFTCNIYKVIEIYFYAPYRVSDPCSTNIEYKLTAKQWRITRYNNETIRESNIHACTDEQLAEFAPYRNELVKGIAMWPICENACVD